VQPFHLVVMGDSYSSGEGTYNQNSNSIDYYADSATKSDACAFEAMTSGCDECHRSPGAYGPLLGVAEQDVIACSGATISAILARSPRYGETPQLTALEEIASRSPVTAVAITAGGDDLNFQHVLQECTNIPLVHGKSFQDCQNAVNEARKRLPATLASLKSLLEEVERLTSVNNSQGAAIFLLDYPRLFPSGHADCNHVDGDKQALLNTAADVIDNEYNNQVADQLPYVHLVDVRPVFAAHEVCRNNGQPYINDLQLNAVFAHNCPKAYLAEEIATGGVCSQSYHPNTAGWAAESGLLREAISRYEATTNGSSCVSKTRPATGIGPGIAGDYRLGDDGPIVAPTSGPNSSPGPFAALGGIYADELNCSPWVEPGSGVTAGVMLQQFGDAAAHIKAGWSETSSGTRTTLVELRDAVTEAETSFGVKSATYERCDQPGSLLHASFTLQCGAIPLPPYLPLPPTNVSSFYTIEFHPLTSPISRTFTVPHLFVKPFNSPPTGCRLEYAVFYRCEQPYVEYGDFKVFLAQPGASARTEIAQAPARFIPNQANVLGETRNEFDQMAGTAAVPEVFDETHVYDDGGWVGFGGSYTYNGLPLNGLNIDYSNALSGSADPLGSSGQRVEIWDQRIP
jgi:hypothetical protein